MAGQLAPGARKLLQAIADRDTGEGVRFVTAPYGRWQMDGTDYYVNDRTFHPLASRDFIDIGNGRTDPVRITTAGRRALESAVT
jgi:hypothetical protein